MPSCAWYGWGLVELISVQLLIIEREEVLGMVFVNFRG
jgi:hypothetical protein